jgi:zinc protease
VALYVVVQVGSRNEVEPGRSGFAHLFEHMMFRGTERFPSEKWEEIMQAAGAETNAYTTDDRTVYHAVFAKEDLEKILELEADRFQNLKYTEEQFRTETRAVLSEYNKSFADPFRKLDEALRDTIYTKHTYKHTTMGYLADVEAMPEMYDYGLQFFDRYYRPEYTIVSIVGDVDFAQSKALIEKYWGGWERGSYTADIPAEPQQEEPKRANVEFHAPTLPFTEIAYRGPAYDDEAIDSAVLDVISFQTFGENSKIYKKLVIEEQKVDAFFTDYPDHVDPYPFGIVARVKDPNDLDYVESQILAEIESLKTKPVPAEELAAVKSHLRYQFALSMNSTGAIARTLAHFLGLRRTPETINKRYRLYDAVTPQDIQTVAQKYFKPEGQTIVRLGPAMDSMPAEGQ